MTVMGHSSIQIKLSVYSILEDTKTKRRLCEIVDFLRLYGESTVARIQEAVGPPTSRRLLLQSRRGRRRSHSLAPPEASLRNHPAISPPCSSRARYWRHSYTAERFGLAGS